MKLLIGSDNSLYIEDNTAVIKYTPEYKECTFESTGYVVKDGYIYRDGDCVVLNNFKRVRYDLIQNILDYPWSVIYDNVDVIPIDPRSAGFVLIDERIFCLHLEDSIRVETHQGAIYIYREDFERWRKLCQ